MSREKSFLYQEMFTRQLDAKRKNGKISCIKGIQKLVPNKCKLLLGDVKFLLNQRVDIFPPHKDTVLLKEPRLYCFLSRCKKDEAKSFMEWDVETVLPREVWKLTSAIEEKDAALAHRDDQVETLEFINEE